jgi:hypothetical protein
MPISFLGRATGLLGSSGTSSLTSVRAMLNEPSTPEDRKFLLGVLALIGGTFFANRYLRPRVMRHLTSQGGNQLVSSPTTLKTETLLATYSALSDLGVQTRTEKPIYDYQYAISFWIYIDAFGPAASTQNVQVMGYGNTIFLHYNSFKNTLSFLTRKNSADATPRILYRAEGFPLQKWNHIVLQNHGGTLDIFYNSELVKSSARVVSQIGADALSIGDPKGAGVSGDITNLVYFNRPIDVTTVRRLYMMGTETRE